MLCNAPHKRQKNSRYERQAKKLYMAQDNCFRKQDFQFLRKNSTHSKLLGALNQIGVCLNDKNPETISIKNLDKVCFILVNTYDRKDYDLGVGPLNDSYLLGMNLYKRGYKIFYLHNPRKSEFLVYSAFFLKNTQSDLTIFYSGRATAFAGSVNGKLSLNINAFLFNEGCTTADELGKILSDNMNPNVKVVLLSDCCGGGSAWDIRIAKKFNPNLPPNILIFSANERKRVKEKTSKHTHGIFTFFFCTLINENPNITPKQLCNQINPLIKRFNKSVSCEKLTNCMDVSPIF